MTTLTKPMCTHNHIYKFPTSSYAKDACLSTGPTSLMTSASSFCPQNRLPAFLAASMSSPVQIAGKQSLLGDLRCSWWLPQWTWVEKKKWKGRKRWVLRCHWSCCRINSLHFLSHFLYLDQNMSSRCSKRKKQNLLSLLFPWRTWQCLNVRTASKLRASKTHTICRSSWSLRIIQSIIERFRLERTFNIAGELELDDK